MNNRAVRILVPIVLVSLLTMTCTLPSITTGSSPTEVGSTSIPPATDAAPSPTPPGDWIEVLAVSPMPAAGISIADPVTVLVRYNLTIPNGLVSVWFDRFSDADCTNPATDSSGNYSLAGIKDEAPGGSNIVAITFPPLPLVEAPYVGVSAELWTPDGNTGLVYDESYAACYAIHGPPTDLEVPAPILLPTPVTMPGSGSISVKEYGDLNGNGRMDADESGGGPYLLILADSNCSTTLAAPLTDSNGNYTFEGLQPGIYCVILPINGALVLPGYFQRIEVVADNTSFVEFGIQEISSLPASPATGYCGDGAVDSSASEECDPPNLTSCTIGCQSWP